MVWSCLTLSAVYVDAMICKPRLLFPQCLAHWVGHYVATTFIFSSIVLYHSQILRSCPTRVQSAFHLFEIHFCLSSYVARGTVSEGFPSLLRVKTLSMQFLSWPSLRAAPLCPEVGLSLFVRTQRRPVRALAPTMVAFACGSPPTCLANASVTGVWSRQPIGAHCKGTINMPVFHDFHLFYSLSPLSSDPPLPPLLHFLHPSLYCFQASPSLLSRSEWRALGQDAPRKASSQPFCPFFHVRWFQCMQKMFFLIFMIFYVFICLKNISSLF